MSQRSRKPKLAIRRPSSSRDLDPEAVDAFVSGRAKPEPEVEQKSDQPSERKLKLVEDQAPKRSRTRTSSKTKKKSKQSPKRRGIVERSDGRLRARMTIYLPPDLAKALRVRCASEGMEISEAVAEAIQKYLDT